MATLNSIKNRIRGWLPKDPTLMSGNQKISAATFNQKIVDKKLLAGT